MTVSQIFGAEHLGQNQVGKYTKRGIEWQ